ncbi:hypothetical protein MRX96_057305 [Rhipicephalus microplus]
MSARHRNTEFGISFSFDRVNPESLDESTAFLDTLRKGGIEHYGLLTVLTFQSDYNFTVSSTREIIAKFKGLQGSDRRTKTILAFGPYEYSAYHMPTIKATFINVVNTFMADIVIAITSTRWLAFEGFCKATLPNTINIDNRDHTFCDFAGGAESYIGDPVYTYGGFSNSSKVLTLSKYKDSLAAKFLKAITELGDLREVTAWLLYNVYNEGPSNSCPEPPFTVLKHFREALKGVENATYH